MTSKTAEKLKKFTHEIDKQLAFGMWADKDLPVVGNDGNSKVVTALAEEKLFHLFKRVENVGGNANIFIDMGDYVTLITSVQSVCAIDAHNADDMTGDGRPSLDAPVGLFVEYLASQDGAGVKLPSFNSYNQQEVKIQERQLSHA